MSGNVEEVTSLGRLRELAPEWVALWQRAGGTPFQRPEWLVPWWERFGAGRLWVLALWSGNRLSGLLPLCREQGRVCFIGEGPSDWLDGLFEDEATGSRLLERLWESDWEFCDLSNLAISSPLLRMQVPETIYEKRLVEDCAPCLELPGKLRRKLGELEYDRRRAARVGKLRFRAGEAGNLEELLEGLFRLHSAQWEARELVGAFSDEAVRGFHRKAARGLLRAGLLRLYGLELGSELAACYYGFFCGKRAFYYQGGFDSKHAALRVGALVVGHAIESAFEEGGEAFDFLRGQEPYKYGWGAGDRGVYRRRFEKG